MPSLRVRVSDRQVQSPVEMPKLQRHLDRRTALFFNHESESRQRGVIVNPFPLFLWRLFGGWDDLL